MKTIYDLIFAVVLFAAAPVQAQQQGWGNEAAKGDMDQIDEPEESDAPAAPQDDAQVKRIPAENPIQNKPLQAEVQPDGEDETEATEAAAPAKWTPSKFVKLQGLNKVTAKTSPINTELGQKVKFGNLEIQVDKCMRGPDSEKPDNTALLTIWDGIPGQPKKQVFHGWMFSSSPAISALEHPIYDVILLACTDK